jgi:hypothetical protein
VPTKPHIYPVLPGYVVDLALALVRRAAHPYTSCQEGSHVVSITHHTEEFHQQYPLGTLASDDPLIPPM